MDVYALKTLYCQQEVIFFLFHKQIYIGLNYGLHKSFV
jgi:hypothetical protein